MSRSLVIAIAGAACAVLGTVVLTVPSEHHPEASDAHPHSTHELSQLAILWDRSESPTLTCDSVVSLATRELTFLETQDGSEGVNMSFFSTGRADSGWEPQLRFMKELLAPVQIIHAQRRYSSQRASLVSELSNSCRQAGRANSSPIYAAFARLSEHLRSAGCGGPHGPHCVLAAATDGQENRAFNWRQRTKPAQLIENSGIQVKICGFAQTVAPEASDTTVSANLNRTWKVLFTHPDSVMIEPYCPQ